MGESPGSFDAAEYWEARHARLRGSAASVGHIALSDAANRRQIREKTGHLARRLIELFPDRSGRRLLDAGCGIGALTRELGQLGFSIVGIDFSRTAIEQARREGCGEFLVANLCDYRPEKAFDVCVCVDVLYHLVVDQEWQDAIESLAESLLPGGSLLIVEHFSEAPSRSPHVVRRAMEEYETAFERTGLTLVSVEQYTTSKSRVKKSLLTCRRRA